ncbi:MAG TPA: TIGR03619 family F420-dependent LLM class oxidoreductase [Candidatus Limnocylindrales bacterium]|nr:TIGR03619 family F420-dependent LLM class oxidoreductase [Candidatus Limnocylindrales bacterium]
MDYGLCLPNVRDVASAELIEAAADRVARLGWASVWTTDHLLVEHASASDYGTTFEAIETLAWVGARHDRLRLATSVIVVPMRNAVILAKELATLDALSRGRLVVGVGVGWNATEFGNVGVADRFRVRGAYLDETIRLWRHLWSGASDPFVGRFHRFDDFVFRPLPAQGATLPIVVGGRAPAALRRAATLGDGYHSTGSSPDAYAARIPTLREAADAAGRPMPALSARLRVQLGVVAGEGYALRGSPEAIAADLRRFTELGVAEVALFFDESTPDAILAAIERFDREVRPLVD